MIFKLCLVFILIVTLSYISLFKNEHFTQDEDLEKAIKKYADNQRNNNKEQMDIYYRKDKERKFKEMEEDVEKYYDKLEQLKQILFKSNKLVCRNEDLHMPLTEQGVEPFLTEDAQTINDVCNISDSGNKAIIDCIHRQIELKCNKLNDTKEACLEFKALKTGASYCSFTPGNTDLTIPHRCESKRLKAPCLHVCVDDNNRKVHEKDCNPILTKTDDEDRPLVVPTKSRIYIKQ